MSALIYELIPKVMAEVGAIEKSRKNAQQGYSFRGIDDVFAAFHGPLSKHGVFYLPEVLDKTVTERQTKSGGTLIYTSLTIAYTFFASDGSNVRAVVVGEAMDSADKSSNKAMSAALKYALLQIFCVPVQMDDADAETPETLPPAMTDKQRAQLADIISALTSHNVAKEKIAEGVSNLTTGRVADWEQLTNQEAAKVIASFSQRLRALSAASK